MPLHLCFNKIKLIAFFCIAVGFAGCNPGSKETRLKFESISDSLYKPDDNYKQALLLWKDYYEQCMNEQLFANAFCLQLQNKVYIGSINNQQEMDVNKGIHLLDTSNYKNIFNLLAVINSANCGDTMKLNNHLKKEFYNEVENALGASPEYKSLAAIIDTGQMKIKIGTVFNTILRPDSLISLLNRTQDSSLIRFKELLLKPENVILAQTVDIFGFSAEFPLKTKLSDQQKKQFEKEIFFTLDMSNDKGSIILLPNNILRIQVNKRYSVLGRFLKLKEV
jgi:hypothetical protein